MGAIVGVGVGVSVGVEIMAAEVDLEVFVVVGAEPPQAARMPQTRTTLRRVMMTLLRCLRRTDTREAGLAWEKGVKRTMSILSYRMKNCPERF